MNKKEAITALADGKRIVHKKFAEFGWVVSYKGSKSHYMSSSGEYIQATAFWKYRQGEEWDKDWSIKTGIF